MIKGTGNRKRTCKSCGKSKIPASNGYLIANITFVCSFECACQLGNKALEKRRSDERKKEVRRLKESEKAAKKQRTERRKGIQPIKYWQDKLQRLVNQWVVHVRDVGKPCCTCGTDSPSIKYDAGHYRTRAAAPELRYELTNIHKQCSVRCNVHGSGMRKEYQGFIEHHYGKEHLEWLDGVHPALKDTFPDWQAYDAEISKYRKKLRLAGVTPCV